MSAPMIGDAAPLETARSTVERAGRLLVVRFARPHATLSWAPIGGGRARASAVVWRHVDDRELGRDADPEALLRASLAGAGLDGAIGLLTARDLDAYEDVTLSGGALAVRCVATVGLGNALAAGDPPGPLLRAVGTINVVVQTSCALAEPALVEVCALAAEARTAALLERRVPSRRSGRPSTGTGTDCIVIAAPDEKSGERWAGKHTALGALVGAAVRAATERGVDRWLAEFGARR
ncbi:MAG TPA: adenosylcobinamide amidohydrolase [Polyangia bacterium]|nr:adenosylcobinamide amidohydrolase [Polyangia bacterium]